MRLLLVRPPATFVRGSLAEAFEIPLGLMYLAAACERAGHDVEIYDPAVEYDLDRMNAGDDGPVHVGASWEDVRARLARTPCDVVGVSNPFYTQYPNALETVRIAREVQPRAKILMGGPHPTVEPARVLGEAPALDVVVRGEAEETIVDLLRAFEAGTPLDGVQGIAFRDRREVVVTERRPYLTDLDALGRPAYHRIDLPKYMHRLRRDDAGRWTLRPHRVLTMLTSRGCPYECVFCSVHLHMGRQYRTHTPRFVLEHVQYVVEELGVHRVYFVDDNLGQDRERFEAILDGLISLRESGRDVTWETPNGIRTDRLTFDLLKKAKRAGCRSIVLTVESGSQRVLDEVIGKRLDLDKVVEVAGWCKRLGLKARSGFIVGLPGETLEEMEETVRFARMLRRRFGIHGHLSTATPYFGTRLYDICREGNFIQGEMTPERLAVAIQGEGIVATPAFSVEDVRAVRRRFERRGMLQTAGKWIERTVKRLVRPRRRVHQHG